MASASGTAKFGVEMQYNWIVFDEFSPTISALKNGFVFTNQTMVDPRITASSRTAYRFGHSMLTEGVDRFDPDNNPIVDNSSVDPIDGRISLGLFEAFLNPTAFLNYNDQIGENTLTPEQAAGAVIRGMTRREFEIDEFVTGLQNNLLARLDLAPLNIARGRDTGLPSLNGARRMFYADTGDTALQPHVSWLDYAESPTPGSFVNFVAAYGTHPSVAGSDALPVTTAQVSRALSKSDVLPRVTSWQRSLSIPASVKRRASVRSTSPAFRRRRGIPPRAW